MTYRQPPLHVPPRHATPPAGAWSGGNSNNFGQSIPFSADANNRQKILQLPEWGAPEEWTVSLGYTYNEAPSFDTSNMNFSIVANVEMGVGGATQSFSIDWVRGTTFTATMNALSIVAMYDPAIIGLGVVVPPDLRLTAMLARGARASNQNPTRSFKILGVHPATRAFATPFPAIPNFARSVQIVQLLNNTAVALPDQYQATYYLELSGDSSGGGVSAIVPFNRILDFGNPGLPIPLASKYWNVRNSDPANDIFVTVVFNIGL